MDNQIAQDITKKSFLKKLLNPKLIFLVIGLIILGEVVYAVRTLRKPVPGAPAKVQPITGGKILLVSPKTIYNIGENIPITARVATGGHSVDGTDLILHFDPNILEATTSSIRKGRIYSEYPITSVDNKSGTIKISGITSTQQKGFNGAGVFASINLKAKHAGKTTVSVDFKPASTNDSNIIETKTAKDILQKVYNLILTIK